MLALALIALGLVLTSGKGPDPVRGPLYGGTFKWAEPWSATTTFGDADLENISRRPVTVSFVSANAHNMRVVGVYLSPDPPSSKLAVGWTSGLPTQDSAAVQGVKSWPQHKTLPATLLPGATQWQIVWAFRVLSPKGGSVHGATLEAHQGGHAWPIKSSIWEVIEPKKKAS